MLRIAPDDAIVTGAATLTVDDPYAIVEPEYAFVHWRLTPTEFESVTASHRVVAPGRGPARPGTDRRRTGQDPDHARSRAADRLRRARPRTVGASLVNEFVETLLELTWHEPKPSYDVVIIGGGGHGLATAYYLATRHGITNVAVIEADYIGSGNSGRNTTIIRANYGIPESIRFYNHSVELYRNLEDETGCWIMHANKGLIWMAHTETGMRAERSRVQLNNACGVETLLVDPMEIKRLCPQIDLTGGGRYPVLGASYHVPGFDRPPRPCRVGVRAGGDATRCSRAAGHASHRAAARRRPRRRREDLARRHRRRHGDERRRRRRLDDRRARRAAPAGAHTSAAGLRHQRLRARARARSCRRPTCSATSRKRHAGRC